MKRVKTILHLLLLTIISSIFIGCFSDTSKESNQSTEIVNRPTISNRRDSRNRQNTFNRRDSRNRRDHGYRDTPIDIPMPHTSNLPIVVIDTLGKWIPDEPKTPARMTIYYDESGERNKMGRSHIHFDGNIGIEVRGQTSQMFPKKQYGFEFRDEQGNDKDVSIFDLPAESDWVLNGPYSDKTLMRNYLAFEFSNRIGRYATRTQFVELFLNTNSDKITKASHYVGVYLLIEKIKRGKERVPIQSLRPNQNKTPEITGGYILKIDKMDHRETFFSTHYGTRLAHVYPKGHEMSNAQKAWIRDYMNDFEYTLSGTKFKDPIHGYAKYIDVDSFIDHFIINELFKNTDGFRFSAYMYKDRGGKLNTGPVWDFNLSMGNTIFHNGWEYDSWLIYTNPVPFWWDRLLSDRNFKDRLVKRWKTLRKNKLTTSAILDEINRTAKYLSESQKRNFQRWSVLGRSLFGNPGPGRKTYQGEVDELKYWMKARLQWMDNNIEKLPGKSTYVHRRRY